MKSRIVENEEVLLSARQRTLAVRRTCTDMRRLADELHPEIDDRMNPEVWLAVADALSISVKQSRDMPDGNVGCLEYKIWRDKWTISLDAYLSEEMSARVLIHEIAHWYLRVKETTWLCDVRNCVYYYEGNPKDEHHRLARRIENLVARRYWKQTYVR